MGEHRWRQRRDNERNCFSSMKLSSGILERECRAVVDRACVELRMVMGWWHKDDRQDVDGQIWNPRRHVASR